MDIKKGTRKEWTGPLIVTTRCYHNTNAQRDHRKRCTETSLLMTLWYSWEFISNISLPTPCLDMGQSHVVKFASICWPWLLGMATASAHSLSSVFYSPKTNILVSFEFDPSFRIMAPRNRAEAVPPTHNTVFYNSDTHDSPWVKPLR